MELFSFARNFRVTHIGIGPLASCHDMLPFFRSHHSITLTEAFQQIEGRIMSPSLLVAIALHLRQIVQSANGVTADSLMREGQVDVAEAESLLEAVRLWYVMWL